MFVRPPPVLESSFIVLWQNLLVVGVCISLSSIIASGKVVFCLRQLFEPNNKLHIPVHRLYDLFGPGNSAIV